ncbi:probable inactive receptor-like protein kinase At3g56050 isoform X1 [Arachis stenosperma]|uniref:probable inactive receptor-like protein kinase At3g56050 isoform X1 n=1 Tax=Arachis stenosperma TaxID=217475 RepID=UPI0025ACC65D|nr:probable inactive receptor-like protein kinase At3g56050 isoform X1 [Arachis stenosperma]XP_057738295.1 probable inactive receptor-like protein kinase At3g56050 isoform X1 [Arachis stenosperma]
MSKKNRKFRDLHGVLSFLALCLLFQSFGICHSLNEEGRALLKLKERIVSDPFGALSDWVDDQVSVDPCNWFGVECSSYGRVVVLNLKDLCLGGTLTPELANLAHIKSIVLRNNSFSGVVPECIVHLKELEVLDLGYNNFSGPLPADLGSNISLSILLLDNNDLLGGFSPEINKLSMLSESQVDEKQLINSDKMPACTERYASWHVGQNSLRRLLQSREHGDIHNRAAANPLSPGPSPQPDPSLASPRPSPASAPSPSQSTPPFASPSPSEKPQPRLKPVSRNRNNSVAPPTASPHGNNSASPPTGSTSGSKIQPETKSSKSHLAVILAGVLGCAAFLIISSIGIYLCKTNKVATVKPWATGLSGQLQKAFVTGVPKLKRSELEAACEDFSNVIGTSPIGTIYKGTLSSGVEIAVASITKEDSKNWSKTSETQFRKKIDTLSKMNHKNFVNLIGFCEEEEPFTRMVVFEYAPNGTLFEHLHIKEAEHLEWGTRLRVAMGMAYCLQHMHQLDPPMAHSNLDSQAIHLTDDYAAKVSDFSYLNEIVPADTKAGARKHTTDTTLTSNVHSFGVILLEIVTGRLPSSADSGSIGDWMLPFLQGNRRSLSEIIDPTLLSFQEEQLQGITALIKSCMDRDPQQRPTMKEVSERLREITKITPEQAVPKLSPLWWAELEISSLDAS